jgi:dimethylglycine dehydrogenase
MKTHSRVVVIGGGIVGCSVLYHLSKLGWTDAVLLEKGELTSGTTWHSVGNTPMFTTSLNLMRLLKYSVELYRTLEQETGQNVGFHHTGSVRLAATPELLEWYKGLSAMAKVIDVSFEMISVQEAKELNPLISEKGLVGASHIPADGYLDPSGVTFALAKGARQRGAEIYRNTRVLGLNRNKSGEWEVVTDNGTLTAEMVVNATGQWANEIGRMVGVRFPIIAMEHQYVVTEAVPELGTLAGEIPITRDPQRSFYLRQEGDGLLIGFYEPNPKPWGVDGIPPNFDQQLLPPDFDQIETLLLGAVERVPALGQAHIKKIINGPDAFTPDTRCLMGPVPGLRNFFILTGFSSFGITFAGGAGKCAAEWIVEGQPSVDMWELDVRRFGPYATSKRYLLDKVVEAYENEYSVHYPHEERPAGRPIKTSPIYDRLKSQGGVFGARHGWERATWFAPPGVEPFDQLTFHRANWFPHVGEECRAVRERVGVLDQTSFGKFEVSGPGATALLDRLCANKLSAHIGKIVVTQMLNERGGVECDLTVTRVAEDRYWVITAAATTTHDFAWIEWHLPADGSVSVRDITGDFACLSLMGPRAREVLGKISDDDVSNAGFSFLTCRDIHIGYAPVRAYRVSYVGELGWELYHPLEYQRSVYDRIMGAGGECGLVNYGYRALDSMRMEKGYRLWGLDMTSQNTPFEAGLGQFVKLDKGAGTTGSPSPFVGREALIRQKEEGIKSTLVSLVVEGSEAIPHGWEPVLDGDTIIGYVTSGEYGHVVDKSIALAYVPMSCSQPGTRLGIKILGERFGATVVQASLYDPTNAKLKQ